MGKQLIYVGSTSEHKLRAVREACTELGIEPNVLGVKTSSEVNEQPEGLVETTYGAAARAVGAWREKLGALGSWRSHGDQIPISIGIESGIMPLIAHDCEGVAQEYIDCAIVILLFGNAEQIATMAPGHMVNAKDVSEARKRGFDKHTVSSVTRERTGCDATDSTPYYTGGRMNRVELLKQAVKLALCQWLATKEGAK